MYLKRDGAVSFYRGLGPMNELRRSDPCFNIEELIQVGWTELLGADAAFFMSPCMVLDNPEGEEYKINHRQVIDVLKKGSKPIIGDWDDLLCECPEDNHLDRSYKETGYRENFKEFINTVDGVIFSTQYMADFLIDKKILKHTNYEIVNNAFNNYLFKYSYNFSEYNKTILWRGSASHYEDFGPYIDQLLNVIDDNKDFTFIFLGFCPDKRIKEMPNVGTRSFIDPLYYFHFIKSLKPSMLFCPLMDIPFNLAKSNIAKIEATHAGAITLSRKFPEWIWSDDDISYFDETNFEEKMSNAIEMIRKKDPKIKELFDFNHTHVRNKYLLSHTNITRAKYIKGVCQWQKF